MSTQIKFGAISNLSDARYAAAAGCEWIGFCLDDTNQNYINPISIKEILGWVSGIKSVAEIGSLTPDDIFDTLNILKINTVQCNAEVNNSWKEAGFQTIAIGLSSLSSDWHMISLSDTAKELNMDSCIVDISTLEIDTVKHLLDLGFTNFNINGQHEAIVGMRDFSDIEAIMELLNHA